MTLAQLSALEQQTRAKIQQTKEALLRLEGYRLCLADCIKATAATTTAVDPPVAPVTPPVE